MWLRIHADIKVILCYQNGAPDISSQPNLHLNFVGVEIQSNISFFPKLCLVCPSVLSYTIFPDPIAHCAISSHGVDCELSLPDEKSYEFQHEEGYKVTSSPIAWAQTWNKPSVDTSHGTPDVKLNPSISSMQDSGNSYHLQIINC